MNTVNKERLEQVFSSIRREAENGRNALKETRIPKIYIGKATCGLASGALDTEKAFEEILSEKKIEANIRSVGCIGHCYAEPVVIIDHPGSGFPPAWQPATRSSPA